MVLARAFLYHIVALACLPALVGCASLSPRLSVDARAGAPGGRATERRGPAQAFMGGEDARLAGTAAEPEGQGAEPQGQAAESQAVEASRVRGDPMRPDLAQSSAPLAIFATRFTSRVLSKAQVYGVRLSTSQIEDFLLEVIQNELVAYKHASVARARVYADLLAVPAGEQKRLVESLLVRFGNSSRDFDYDFLMRLERMAGSKRSSSQASSGGPV